MITPDTLVGRTIVMIDVTDSITIRLDNGAYLEINGDQTLELNGDERNIVEAWYKGEWVQHGRAEMRDRAFSRENAHGGG